MFFLLSFFEIYFCIFTIQNDLMANYFYIITVLVLLFSLSVGAQELNHNQNTKGNRYLKV
jgi:hypothetical protein